MGYSLATSYVGDALLSGFNWFDGTDLSNGFVAYQSQQNASDLGLYSVDSTTGAVRLGVDHTNTYPTDSGRPSIRLESKTAYNHGLFIADFLHMPPSQCGLWPAFWAYGSPWPEGGEVDIIEGANLAYTNTMSGHTSDNCYLSASDSDLFSGTAESLDCAVGSENVGCPITPPTSDTSSYGDSFNAVNGGVYAMLWDSEYIKLWHFPRGSIPSDIESKNPDPSNWGLPEALFGGSSCEVDSFFKDMQIVLNINFCGDYGAATWGDYATCTALSDSCVDYVANNPAAFKNAYWDVSYIDVYNITDTPVTTVTVSVPASNSTAFPTLSHTYNSTAEPTSTTTVTTWSTLTVVVPGQETTSSAATATDAAPANPTAIGDYTYLGCFGSTSHFKTFDLKDEDDSDMTLEKCVSACNGITYAGIFEGKCYCATDLDASTSALADESSCDHPCPGDSSEFCGGLVDAQNVTVRSFRIRGRDAPNNYLLTVYADLSNSTSPAAPPPMAAPAATVTATATVAHPRTRTTTVTYFTPCPTAASMMAQEFVATVTLEECDCEEPTYAAVAMATKVVNCNGCGEEGESAVTITVPVAQNTSVPAITTSAANATSTTISFSPQTPAVVTAQAAGGFAGVRLSLVVSALAIMIAALM